MPDSKSQQPSLGRIVLYTLNDQDAQRINRRRTDGDSIRERMEMSDLHWHAGAQAHIGNSASPGEEFPAIVVAVSGSTVSAQVFLDGNDVLWVKSIDEGTGEGTWRWPPRV